MRAAPLRAAIPPLGVMSFAVGGATRPLLNFFPLGHRVGPLAFDKPNMAVGQDGYECRPSHRLVKVRRRADLKLQCRYCRFAWRFDSLCVVCPASPEHSRIEANLNHAWMWNVSQADPKTAYKDLLGAFNPRTGLRLGMENAKSKNNERRAQGLTTNTLNKERYVRGVSARYIRMDSFSRRWHVRFPYPS